jgi:hypothetical protein
LTAGKAIRQASQVQAEQRAVRLPEAYGRQISTLFGSVTGCLRVRAVFRPMAQKALIVFLSAVVTFAARSAAEVRWDGAVLDRSTFQRPPNPERQTYKPSRKLHGLSAPAPPPPVTNFAAGKSDPWWRALHANYSALAAQSDLPGQVIIVSCKPQCVVKTKEDSNK